MKPVFIKYDNYPVAALTWLEGFDGNWSGVVPQPLVNLSKLAMTNLADEFEGALGDFPLVLGVVREANCLWLFFLL